MSKKNMKMAAVIVFVVSAVFFHNVDIEKVFAGALVDERELGRKCVENIIPNAKIAADEYEEKQDEASEKINSAEKNRKKEKKVSKKEVDKIEKGNPLVIIYHTHASESYMPYKESNYHRSEVTGTVRDVGNVLESELEAKGINVIHDVTVHDRPSYNESYDRSLQTVKTLQKKYPSAEYIIDLHRDAAPASADEGKWLDISGKRVAKFSMVVGQANENYVELYDFAENIQETAEAMYDGFGGAIIEQNYNYNEFVSNKCLLLEIGNNKNTIEESRRCAEYFADVLAKIIKEEH